MTALTCMNVKALYSAFAMSVLSPVTMAIFCHPLFIIPSLWLNFIMHHKYRVLYKGDRARVVNMLLKPNVNEIIVET